MRTYNKVGNYVILSGEEEKEIAGANKHITAEAVRCMIEHQGETWEADGPGLVCYGVHDAAGEVYRVQVPAAVLYDAYGRDEVEEYGDYYYDEYLSTSKGAEICQELADMLTWEDIAPEGFSVEVTEWQEGSGYGASYYMDPIDDRTPEPGEAEALAECYDLKPGDIVEIKTIGDWAQVVDSITV